MPDKMEQAYTVTITVYKLSESTAAGLPLQCVGRVLTYTAVYDPNTKEFISDYVPEPGDSIVVTVTEKETGNVVAEYSTLIDESEIDESSNGISIKLTGTTTVDESGDEIVVFDVDVKPDTVDIELIVNRDTTDTPDTPDTPDTTGIKLGDVNRDGKVTAKDSMMIQQYTINLVKLSDDQLSAADIDGDKKITNKDAMNILRFTINPATKYDVGKYVV